VKRDKEQDGREVVGLKIRRIDRKFKEAKEGH
jgi:hypothetical protein